MSTVPYPEIASPRRGLNGPAGRAMRQLRREGLRQFAAEVGITPGYLSKIEKGQQQPSEDVQRAIATRLGVDVSEITQVVGAHDIVRAFGRPVEHWNGARLERLNFRAVVVLDDGSEVECEHEGGHSRDGVRECVFRLIDRLEREGVTAA